MIDVSNSCTKAGGHRSFLRGHALPQRRLALRGRADVRQNGAAAVGRRAGGLEYLPGVLSGHAPGRIPLRPLVAYLAGPRRQAVLHLVLLGLPWLVLPIGVAEGWLPPADAFPVPWLWMLLSVSVGLPFLVVSATAPMLQAWFSRHGKPVQPRSVFSLRRQQSGQPAGLAELSLGDRVALDPGRADVGLDGRLWSFDAADCRLRGAVVAIVAGAQPPRLRKPLGRPGRPGYAREPVDTRPTCVADSTGWSCRWFLPACCWA